MLDRPIDIARAEPPRNRELPGSPGRENEASRESLAGFLTAVRLRRKTLVATIVLIPLCALLTLRQVTPLYTATGSLIYDPSEYKAQELQSVLRADPTTESIMASQAEILHSLHIAEQVAIRGNLFASPAFNPALRPPGLVHRTKARVRSLLGMEEETPPEPVYGPVWDQARDRTLQAVQDALHAAAVRASHVVEVSFTAEDPMVAAAAVNNAMDAYIKEQYAAKHRAVEGATRLLETQAAELRRQVHDLEERMSAYRTSHALGQGIHAGTDTEEITHLTEDLAKAQSDRAAATARLDAARGRAGAEAQAAVAPSVTQLRAQQEQLAGQIKALQVRLGSAHPEVQGLNRQLADSQRALSAEIARVVAATGAEERAATERVRTLEGVLDQAKAAAESSARAQIPLNAMNRDLDAARGQLQAVLDRIEQMAQQASVESSEAHEISQAVPPDRPSSPRVVQTMAAAVVAAVFLGVLLIYLLHLTDTTLHSGLEMRAATGLPCLALVPEVVRRSLGRLALQDYVVHRPLTAFAEQVRALRASLALALDQPQIITVTGVRPAEGKSTLALCLGRSLQMSGKRVLAIECDVRQSSFQYRLEGWAAPGLLDLLRGTAGWREAIQDDKLTGMQFITAGKPGGDVAGMFMAEGMRQLLTGLRPHYDVIVLDAPPVEAMTEARIAAALADATLLCVRWRSTRTHTVLHALEMLRDAHAKIIGTVLTRVDPRVHLRAGYADAGVYHRRYKAYFRG
ncbi:MAG TPA: cellulose synthase operon protein YhjQ/BcsQ [Rhodopila sp.]|nr:cellulose synthase operon protein YhjQ/BcsQ [Rhodopila sp.]